MRDLSPVRAVACAFLNPQGYSCYAASPTCLHLLAGSGGGIPGGSADSCGEQLLTFLVLWSIDMYPDDPLWTPGRVLYDAIVCKVDDETLVLDVSLAQVCRGASCLLPLSQITPPFRTCHRPYLQHGLLCLGGAYRTRLHKLRPSRATRDVKEEMQLAADRKHPAGGRYPQEPETLQAARKGHDPRQVFGSGCLCGIRALRRQVVGSGGELRRENRRCGARTCTHSSRRYLPGPPLHRPWREGHSGR